MNRQMTFVIEADRCIGCHGCQVACKLENEVALGVGRNKVCTVGPTGHYPDLQMYFLAVMCQQCEHPTCVDVCPTGACYKSDADGVIHIDRSQCIGCGSCMRACPYGCIRLNQELRVADKCDLCAHAREAGDTPACVRNCAGGALHYGDVNDPDSAVSRLLSGAKPEEIHTLRDFGNAPTVRYILKHGTWQDVLPQDCVEHSVRRRGGAV